MHDPEERAEPHAPDRELVRAPEQAATKIAALLQRIGGILVAPRQTLEHVQENGPGGVRDLLLVLALQVLVLQLPGLVSAAWFMVSVSYGAGISALLNTISNAMLVPVVLLFAGIIGVNAATRRAKHRGRNLDLVALCLVPLVALELIYAAVRTVAGSLGHRSILVVMVAGIAWYVGLLVVAARVVHADQGSAGDSPPRPQSANRAPLAVGVAVTALLLLVAAVQAHVMATGPGRVRPLRAGDVAPEFALPTDHGDRVRLGDLRGKVVVVSFWASFCGPCMEELPRLSALQAQHREGLVVLAVNVEGSVERARETRAALTSPLTMLVDDGSAAARYGVQSLPHLVLLDCRGKVAKIHIGAQNFAAVEQAVARELIQPAARELIQPAR